MIIKTFYKPFQKRLFPKGFKGTTFLQHVKERFR